MRTTVTLDPDVHQLVQDAAHKSGKPFRRALNDAVRVALQKPGATSSSAPTWPCHDLGLPLVDLTKALSLADELDDLRQ